MQSVRLLSRAPCSRRFQIERLEGCSGLDSSACMLARPFKLCRLLVLVKKRGRFIFDSNQTKRRMNVPRAPRKNFMPRMELEPNQRMDMDVHVQIKDQERLSESIILRTWLGPDARSHLAPPDRSRGRCVDTRWACCS
jgi:hypothetical protein